MSTTNKEPIFFTCKEEPGYLNTLEDKIRDSAGKNAYLLLDCPVIYLHVWQSKNDINFKRFKVYVGEADNVVRRQSEHWLASRDSDKWQYKMAHDKDGQGNPVVPTLYVIGHEYFQKSMTLDIEDRLFTFCCAIPKAKTQNGRHNAQGKYHDDGYADAIFGKIWNWLNEQNPKLFLPASEIRNSAIYKASPNHRLTDDQRRAKSMIIERVFDALINNKSDQLVMVEGEVGTGKTVLASSAFFDLLRKSDNVGCRDIKSYLLVNRDELHNTYTTMTKQLGYEGVSLKPQNFINKTPEDQKVDVAFVDEAHLLMEKQGKQGQKPNMLENIMKRARVTVIMFDENQILGRQHLGIDPADIEELRDKSVKQGNHYRMQDQLRMNCSEQTMEWIDSVTKDLVIPDRPLTKDRKGYEIRSFDSPAALSEAIEEKASGDDSLSRLIATYDWPFTTRKRPEKEEFWGVRIGNWFRPWNKELLNNSDEFKELPNPEKRRLKSPAWAEQEHTIREVGSIYTIQGFDLTYAGVIIGPSVYYDEDDKKIKFDASENCSIDMKGTVETEGATYDVAEKLIQNQLRILLTRGSKGLYIYACDEALRKTLNECLN